MQPIAPKTLLDLEFDKVIDRVQALCKTESGQREAAAIRVFRVKEDLLFSLSQTNEYLASLTTTTAFRHTSLNPSTRNSNSFASKGLRWNYQVLRRFLPSVQSPIRSFAFLRNLKSIMPFCTKLPKRIFSTNF